MTHKITNDRHTRPGWVVSGIVESPVAEVWRALIEINPTLSASDKAMILQSQDALFSKIYGKPGEGHVHIEVDPTAHSIAEQGEWWYRGVTTVEQHPKGSLVTNRVYNIAPGIGWWAAQWVQGAQHARIMPTAHQQLLDAIAAQLGYKVHLIVGN